MKSNSKDIRLYDNNTQLIVSIKKQGDQEQQKKPSFLSFMPMQYEAAIDLGREFSLGLIYCGQKFAFIDLLSVNFNEKIIHFGCKMFNQVV